jgi:hypothetical protein
MPSPFPGMNPYLEHPEDWPDFHGAFLFALRAAINAVLPDRYVALVDRHVWLHDPDSEERLLLGIPDVTTVNEGGANEGTTAAVLEVAPITVTLPAVPHKGNLYIRLIDRAERKVVTVVELLSPSNKRAGRDRQAYLAKRDEYLASGTNLVEIDFLRAGQRMPLGEPPLAETDYYLFVSRAASYPKAGLWPFSVRDPMPPLLVPLLPGDVTPKIELKPCIDRAYDEGRYDKELDYLQSPVPPLREPDATWARELLANIGL